MLLMNIQSIQAMGVTVKYGDSSLLFLLANIRITMSDLLLWRKGVNNYLDKSNSV